VSVSDCVRRSVSVSHHPVHPSHIIFGLIHHIFTHDTQPAHTCPLYPGFCRSTDVVNPDPGPGPVLKQRLFYNHTRRLRLPDCLLLAYHLRLLPPTPITLARNTQIGHHAAKPGPQKQKQETRRQRTALLPMAPAPGVYSFLNIPPAFHLYPACISPYIISLWYPVCIPVPVSIYISSHFAFCSRSKSTLSTVSRCIPLYTVSSCIRIRTHLAVGGCFFSWVVPPCALCAPLCWRVGPVCCAPLRCVGLCPRRYLLPLRLLSTMGMGPPAQPSGVGTPESGWLAAAWLPRGRATARHAPGPPQPQQTRRQRQAVGRLLEQTPILVVVREFLRMFASEAKQRRNTNRDSSRTVLAVNLGTEHTTYKKGGRPAGAAMC